MPPPAGAGEFLEGARAVRQRLGLAGLPAMLLLGASSRRRCGRGRRAGTPGRSRSRCRRAAARPDGPRPRRGNTRPRRPARQGRCTATKRPVRCAGSVAPTLPAARPRCAAWPCRSRACRPASRPSWRCRRRARRRARRRTRPESSDSAGRPVALAAAKRLDVGVFLEGRAGLVRFGQAEFLRRLRLEAERRHQVGEFAQLALIVARHDDLPVRRVVRITNPRFVVRRIRSNCRTGRGNRSSGRRSAIRNRLRWRCPFGSSRAFQRVDLVGASRQSRDGPGRRVPCGGTGSRASGGGGLRVASALKSSSTPAPQRKKTCRPSTLAIRSSPSTSRVERLGRVEIGDVERRFEDGGGLHAPPTPPPSAAGRPAARCPSWPAPSARRTLPR